MTKSDLLKLERQIKLLKELVFLLEKMKRLSGVLGVVKKCPNEE
jgi:hypothetical protein